MLNKGHIVTKKELAPRPSDRKGKTSKRVHFVRSLIREVAGFAPYEKRITELLKVGKDKRALKVAKRKLGTHKRAKRKREEMSSVLRKMSFHPDYKELNVTDPESIASLADFVQLKFGKLDILAFKAIAHAAHEPGGAAKVDWSKITSQPYEAAAECLQTNYYGVKRVTAALLPFLQLSDHPIIVNVSSSMNIEIIAVGLPCWVFQNIPSERIRRILDDIENLNKDKLDELLEDFLKDSKDGVLESKGWPMHMGAYTVSKAALNAYTRILAKKYPNVCINSVCPGYVKTDINFNTGILSVEDGAASVVRLAFLPKGAPSGCFFVRQDEYAVVTGANKGIGFEVVWQLASKQVAVVVLTARDEQRGLEAVEKLKAEGLFDYVVFHQLNVTDPESIASLAEFVKSKFGKLDILVNNAGIEGTVVDVEAFKAVEHVIQEPGGVAKVDWSKIISVPYEAAVECLQTNYYGAKRIISAHLPFLQLSDHPIVVNVSSTIGQLKNIPSKRIRGILNDIEKLTEDRLDELVEEFLKDLKDGVLESKGWPLHMPAYTISKVALNAYTRIMAKKYPYVCINSVCPGNVKTDLNLNNGNLSVEDGAARVLKLAMLPKGAKSGYFFRRQEASDY
ncbi:hypothetical protein QQ045_033364 [Rhodiola kirilowii]